jgi:hypothetical protein
VTRVAVVGAGAMGLAADHASPMHRAVKPRPFENARAAGRDLVSYLQICETDGACRNRTKRQKLHFEAARCSLVRRSHREKIFFFYVRLEFNSKPPLFESANYPIGV